VNTIHLHRPSVRELLFFQPQDPGIVGRTRDMPRVLRQDHSLHQHFPYQQWLWRIVEWQRSKQQNRHDCVLEHRLRLDRFPVPLL